MQDYLKASIEQPYMGLNNKVCTAPVYWCPVHEVWLSESDVINKGCFNKPTFDMLDTYKCPRLQKRFGSIEGLNLTESSVRLNMESNVKDLGISDDLVKSMSYSLIFKIKDVKSVDRLMSVRGITKVEVEHVISGLKRLKIQLK